MSISLESLIEKLSKTLFCLAILFLTFIAGVLAALHKTDIAENIEELEEYTLALYQEYTADNDEYNWSLWTKSDPRKGGVTQAVPEQFSAGHTLFTTNFQQAFLVDMRGKILHRWHLPFDEIWGKKPSHIKFPLDTNTIVYSTAHLYPNGDLLTLYDIEKRIPSGIGLAKLDKDSKLIWKYTDHVHHALYVEPKTGTIYSLSEKFTYKNTYNIDRTNKPPFKEDFVLILSPEGKLLKKISIINAFKNSNYVKFLYRGGHRDITHANHVEYISKEMAEHFHFADEGDLIISLRNLHTIAILDPKNETIKWASAGFWKDQHFPQLLPNGTMLVFDNNGFSHRKESRVVEFHPNTKKIVWQYPQKPQRNFFTPFRGTQQRLSNGNTLINLSTKGRLLEVTPDHKIVWEYYNPVRKGKDNEYIAIIRYMHRYPTSYATFLSKQE